MMTVNIEKSGTFPRPGPLGRGVRFVAGVVLLYFFIVTLINFPAYVSLRIPTHLLLWVGVAFSIYALPEVVGIALGRDLGRRPQIAFGALAIAAVIFNLAWYSSWWGPPLGLLLFLLLAYVTGVAGVSFLLAGALAVPG
ncbi:MAG: hypothetical protein ACE5F6_08355 [Anaerolineae bacterium]